MVQTLEDIKGGGGSIKLGTTGTISALMSKELESTKSASKVPTFSSGEEASRILKPGTSPDEASSSSTGSSKNHKSPENSRRKQGTPQIPMLKSDGISKDGTPVRKKPVKKRPGVVEIVDIKCGNPDKTWVTPITHRLKKLGFSKLSNSVV